MLKLSNIVRLRKVEFYQKNNLTLINVHRKINPKPHQTVIKSILLESHPRFKNQKLLDNPLLAQNKEKTTWLQILLVSTEKSKKKEVRQIHLK
jgi:hypothetical protein